MRVLILALVALACLSNASASQAPLTSESFMPISEVKPGMKGTGKTVFSGNRIQSFDFEVLGIWSKTAVGRDLILVRCSGPEIQRTGVVAGMSGSPLYIDGKLIGALSAGWPWAKEPLAAVTPIHEMLALLEGGKSPAPASPGTGMPSPIATPLFLSGFDARVIEENRKRLTAWGFEPVTGGAVAGTVTASAPAVLEPGSAVCVTLSEGDFAVAALGTVTFTRDDAVLAFGHPFLGMGAVALPMNPAVVHTIVPSYNLAIKIGNSLPPIGAILADGATGIMGRVGAKAPMTDVTLEMSSKSEQLTRQARIARHPDLSGTLLQMLAASFVLERQRTVGPLTVRSRVEADLEGGKKVVLRSAASSTAMPPSVLMELLEPLELLLRNPYEAKMPERVKMTFDVSGEAKLATLDSIRLNKSRFRPGETVEVTATLRSYGGALSSHTVRVPLPSGLEAARATVEVLDARSATVRDRLGNPARYAPRDHGAMLELLESARTPTSLYVRLSLPRNGAALEGRELPQLPGSFLSVLSDAGTTGVLKLASDVETELPTDQVVSGQDALPIEILSENER